MRASRMTTVLIWAMSSMAVAGGETSAPTVGSGRPDGALASASQAAQTINALRTTSSWELTGPLRVLGRAWRRLRQGARTEDDR